VSSPEATKEKSKFEFVSSFEENEEKIGDARSKIIQSRDQQHLSFDSSCIPEENEKNFLD